MLHKPDIFTCALQGEQSAQLIDHLKKSDMASEAERLLAGTGWLPAVLRTPGHESLDPTEAGFEGGEAPSANEVDLPTFLVEGEPAPTERAFLAGQNSRPPPSSAALRPCGCWPPPLRPFGRP